MKLTAAQRRVVGVDGVTLVGTDARGRPVVSQERRFSGGKIETWALTKSGDPTDVTEPVTKETP